jgi:hypothetical protein
MRLLRRGDACAPGLRPEAALPSSFPGVASGHGAAPRDNAGLRDGADGFHDGRAPELVAAVDGETLAVIQLAAGSAKKRTASEMSYDSPLRPSGM